MGREEGCAACQRRLRVGSAYSRCRGGRRGHTAASAAKSQTPTVRRVLDRDSMVLSKVAWEKFMPRSGNECRSAVVSSSEPANSDLVRIQSDPQRSCDAILAI
jgi:hypothetical protein